MDSSKQLRDDKILSLIIRFSIPAIVGMMVNAIYNVVDRIFIGKFVGASAFAGAFLVYPYMLITIAFGMLIGIGATSLVSIRLGEDKKQAAEKVLGNAFSLLIIISVLLTTVTLLFLEPILLAFGASESTLPFAKDYLRIIAFGFPFQLLGFGMNNFIRAEGRPKIAMLTMLLGAVLNIVLDPIFIIVFKLGIKGAAYATVLSQLASAIWVMKYFFGGDSLLKIRRANISLDRALVFSILAFGSAQFSIQLANSGISLLYNRSLGYYGGDMAISSYGIINSLAVMILMPIFGINQGAQPIVGYNFGAKNYTRVKHTLKLAIIGATAISTLGFLLSTFVPELLVSFFSKSAELNKLAVKGIRIFFMVFPIVGFQIVSSNYFQATGKPRKALFLSLSRQVIILIPAIILLPIFFGLDGIWFSAPISDLISSFLTAGLLYKDLKQMG